MGVLAPALDVLTRDVPCAACEYNLKGLPGVGKCPECGTLISDSLRRDLLRYASDEHLRRLHRGVVLVEFGLCLQLATIVGAIAFPIFMGLWDLLPPEIAGAIGLLAVIGSAAITVTGWWLLTIPNPVKLELPEGMTARRFLRGAAVASLPSLLGLIAGEMYGGGSTALTPPPHVLLRTAFVAAHLAMLFASLAYIRELAGRIPDGQLNRHSRDQMWLIPLLCTVGLAFVLGPVIGFALYIGLLERLRFDLKWTRQIAARRRAEAANSAVDVS